MLPIRLTLPLTEHGYLKHAFPADASARLLIAASAARDRLAGLDEKRLTTIAAVRDALAVAEAYRDAWTAFFHQSAHGPVQEVPTVLWSGFAWRTSPSLEGPCHKRDGTHRLLTHCPHVEATMVAWTVCELRFALAYHAASLVARSSEASRLYARAILDLDAGHWHHQRLCFEVPYRVRAGAAECRTACRRALLALLSCLAERAAPTGCHRWAAERAADAVHHMASAGDHGHSTVARLCWTMRQVAWGDMNMAVADALLDRVRTEDALIIPSADAKALEMIELSARAAHLAVLYAAIALRYAPLAVQAAGRDSKLFRELGMRGNEKRVAAACIRVATNAMDAYDIRQSMVPAKRQSLTMLATFRHAVHFQEKVLRLTPAPQARPAYAQYL